MAEHEAFRLLDLADVRPGTNTMITAHHLGLRIVPWDLPSGVNGAVIRGEPAIYISRALDFDSALFVVGHEIFELTLSDRLPAGLHEWYCDAGATALLNPRAFESEP